jgi:hypothetical protein
LNLNVHYHVAVPDGIFTRKVDSTPAEFYPLPRPTQLDLEEIAYNTDRRVTAWLRRVGLVGGRRLASSVRGVR